jgi:hypothetical protein
LSDTIVIRTSAGDTYWIRLEPGEGALRFDELLSPDGGPWIQAWDEADNAVAVSRRHIATLTFLPADV